MKARDTVRVGAWLGILALLAVGPMACGGGGSSAEDPSRTYVGTQSPGDLWAWALDPDGTFTARNQTLAYDYAGTWTVLPSDFLLLTVTSTTEPGMVTPATAYAVEVPWSALVVKPAGAAANVIVAVSTTSCPSGVDMDLGWVELADASFDVASDSAYGTADVTMAGSTWDVEVDAFLLDGTSAGSDSLPGMTCAAGIVTDPADADAVLAMASTGVFVRDGGPGDGAAIGMRLPTTPVDLADLVAAGREFRGIHYRDDSPVAEDSVPVWARPDGAGGLWGHEYDDIETNVESPPPYAQVTFDTQVRPGIVRGTLTDSAGMRDIVYVIGRLGGRYFVFGISVDTHDGTPYNFIVVETTP